ncbi:MAG: hypothetical protein ACOCXH_15925 [Cyclobacteriaceae bacterium]
MDFENLTVDRENGMKVEVVAVAKEILKTKDFINGLGGYNIYGTFGNYDVTGKEEIIPWV